MREKLEHLRWYYSKSDSDIISLIDAIIDKKWGMGLIWQSTDFKKIRENLEGYPDRWVIGQDRDFLFELVDDPNS